MGSSWVLVEEGVEIGGRKEKGDLGVRCMWSFENFGKEVTLPRAADRIF